jgi:CRISPR-associated protein Cas5t
MSTQLLDAVRIEVRAYTASFRLPGMMGYQTTSPVPPPSAIYGLIAAACGREVTPEEAWIAYRFSYEARASDLEKIIFFGEGGPKWETKMSAPASGVLTREFLWNPLLTLYLPRGEIAQAFRHPFYPLLLGRSQDVAYVSDWRETQLEPIEEAPLSGVLLPFPVQHANLRSRLASFPTFFTVEAQRRARAVKPFHIVDYTRKTETLAPVRAPNLCRETGEGASVLGVAFFDAKSLS